MGSLSVENLPWEQREIRKVLPHRDPFVWVTRVTSCTPGESIVAELQVDPALELFKGHFPEHPVLPGVILMEALAQAACICILVGRDEAGSIGFLTGIDNAKFRKQVHPGDTVVLKATVVKSSRRMCVAEVQAFVGEDVCASATQKYVLGTK